MKFKSLSSLLTGLSLSILLFSSCLKDGDDTLVLPTPDGKIPYSVIPENLQDSLRDNGFVIHEGFNPPSIEGKYVITPMNLLYASDRYENAFHDLYMSFTGQHRRGPISYSEMQIDTVVGRSAHANVIGDGDEFSMYCLQTVCKTNQRGDTLYTCSTVTVVSGLIAPAGINECQYATIILDKWAINDYYASQIPDAETFRIWNDGDALAERLAGRSTK